MRDEVGILVRWGAAAFAQAAATKKMMQQHHHIPREPLLSLSREGKGVVHSADSAAVFHRGPYS